MPAHTLPKDPKREVRYLSAPIELRAVTSAPASESEVTPAEGRSPSPALGDEAATTPRQVEQSKTVRGYAALFESRSEDLGYYGPVYEVIERGAFEACDMSDVVCLFNHDESQPLARTGAGLTLGVDERGLYYEFPLLDTTLSRDLGALFKAGIISQSSFAFTVSQEEGSQSFEPYRDAQGNEAVERRIKKIARLYDVSPVTRPAYADTSVALRALKAAQAQQAAKPLGEEPLASGSQDKAACGCPPPLTARQLALLHRKSAAA